LTYDFNLCEGVGAGCAGVRSVIIGITGTLKMSQISADFSTTFSQTVFKENVLECIQYRTTML